MLLSQFGVEVWAVVTVVESQIDGLWYKAIHRVERQHSINTIEGGELSRQGVMDPLHGMAKPQSTHNVNPLPLRHREHSDPLGDGPGSAASGSCVTRP